MKRELILREEGEENLRVMSSFSTSSSSSSSSNSSSSTLNRSGLNHAYLPHSGDMASLLETSQEQKVALTFPILYQKNLFFYLFIKNIEKNTLI